MDDIVVKGKLSAIRWEVEQMKKDIKTLGAQLQEKTEEIERIEYLYLE